MFQILLASLVKHRDFLMATLDFAHPLRHKLCEPVFDRLQAQVVCRVRQPNDMMEASGIPASIHHITRAVKLQQTAEATLNRVERLESKLDAAILLGVVGGVPPEVLEQRMRDGIRDAVSAGFAGGLQQGLEGLIRTAVERILPDAVCKAFHDMMAGRQRTRGNAVQPPAPPPPAAHPPLEVTIEAGNKASKLPKEFIPVNSQNMSNFFLLMMRKNKYLDTVNNKLYHIPPQATLESAQFPDRTVQSRFCNARKVLTFLLNDAFWFGVIEDDDRDALTWVQWSEAEFNEINFKLTDFASGCINALSPEGLLRREGQLGFQTYYSDYVQGKNVGPYAMHRSKWRWLCTDEVLAAFAEDHWVNGEARQHPELNEGQTWNLDPPPPTP